MPTRGIILTKYCFLKGVKPHCSAKYALFLTTLGRPTEIHPCTQSAFNAMEEGLLDPKWRPSGHQASKPNKSLLSRRGKTTLLREIGTVLNHTWLAYAESHPCFTRGASFGENVLLKRGKTILFGELCTVLDET